MKTKIYIDCTHTFYSSVNTGIQRVVKNIVNSSPKVASLYAVEIIPVRLYKKEYFPFTEFPKKLDKKNLDKSKRFLKSIYNFLNSTFKHVPFFTNILNSYQIRLLFSRIFNTLSVRQKVVESSKVVFKKGDILLLIDATWSNCDYELLEKAKTSGVTIIPIIYDIIPITHNQYCQLDLVKAFEIWLKKSYLLFDYYIAISNTVKNDIYLYIKNNYDKDINIDRFDHFTLGSNFSKKEVDYTCLSTEYKNIFKNKVFITVSTVEARKNHSYILDAFEKLWEKGVNVTYVIIGKVGWKVDSLIERIVSHKEYNHRLFMQNNINDTELVYAYNHAEALIHASFVEGFGLPIIEALQYNLQVLASDIPIHREVGKNNISFFNLKNVNSLVQLIEKNEFYKSQDSLCLVSWEESTSSLIEKILKLNEKMVINK